MGRAGKREKRREFVPAVVFAAGLLLTAAVAFAANAMLAGAEISDASRAADHATAAVRLALDRAGVAVRAVHALYTAQSVSGSQFDRFARILMTSDSVSAVGFLRRVYDAERTAYERELTTPPARDLGIWETSTAGTRVRAGERPVYYVSESAYPHNDADPGFGLDVGSQADRAGVLVGAMEQMVLAVTDRVMLEQLGEPGIVFYDPVIDRDGRSIGAATASLTVSALMRIVAEVSGVTNIDLAIGAPGSATASAPDKEEPVAEREPGKRAFNFADRLWTVSVPIPAVAGPVRFWGILLIIGLGLTTTAAVLGYLVSLAKTEEANAARQRLRAMIDGLGPVALLLTPDGAVVNANRAAAAMFGRSEDDIVGRRIEDLLAGSGNAAESERVRAAMAPAGRGESVRFDVALDSEDGRQVFDLWIRRADPAGDVVASAVDITDRHEAEETQRLLMRELDHRMKNALQVIQAIVRRTAASQDSIAGFESSLLGRLGAMSRAHDLLASERWHGADIREIFRQEAAQLSDGALDIDGPSIRLNPRAAQSMALVIHELSTNAVKYGSLSLPGGRATARWWVESVRGQRSLVLRWEEHDGPKVRPPKRRGFGSLLIERSIAHELDGTAELDYRESGLVCSITVPLGTARPFATDELPVGTPEKVP
jgi:PAS domain S-box-containing protein